MDALVQYAKNMVKRAHAQALEEAPSMAYSRANQ
jgi:hypothetical protein